MLGRTHIDIFADANLSSASGGSTEGSAFRNWVAQSHCAYGDNVPCFARHIGCEYVEGT